MPTSPSRYLDDLAGEQAMLDRLYPTMAGEGPQTAGAPDQPNTKRILELEEDLKHPNVQAFLTTIAQAEGSTYDSAFGDSPKRPRKFDGYEKFPGSGKNPSASGRYQIIEKTYNGLSKELGLNDFSPHTQDLMAAQLLRTRGAMDHIKRGDIEPALPALSKEWAALPKSRTGGSHYGQPHKTYEELRSMFELNRAP